jgi:hypothetical protein
MVAKDGERELMQQIYLFVAGGLVVIAGLISLINRPAGLLILSIAGISFGIFIINAVVWSLAKSSLESYFYNKKLESTKTTKKKR